MMLEPTAEGEPQFMGLLEMFAAMMTKMEQIDENYKSLDKNIKSLGAKIDEKFQTLDDKMEIKFQALGNKEAQISKQLDNVVVKCYAAEKNIEQMEANFKYLEYKIEKKSIDIWEVISSMDTQDIAQMEKIESDEAAEKFKKNYQKSKVLGDKVENNFKEISQAFGNMEAQANDFMETIAVNSKSLDGKVEMESEEIWEILSDIEAEVNKQKNDECLNTSDYNMKRESDNIYDMLNYMNVEVNKKFDTIIERIEHVEDSVVTRDMCPLLKSHMWRLAFGVQIKSSDKSMSILDLSNETPGFSNTEVSEVFSTYEVPNDFNSFLTIILRHLKRFDDIDKYFTDNKKEMININGSDNFKIY